MFIPLWAVISILAIQALTLGVKIYGQFLRRHHDHLIASTPRRSRG